VELAGGVDVGGTDLGSMELTGNANLGGAQKATSHEPGDGALRAEWGWRNDAEDRWGAATTHRRGGGGSTTLRQHVHAPSKRSGCIIIAQFKKTDLLRCEEAGQSCHQIR